jgi:hypothetical protein
MKNNDKLINYRAYFLIFQIAHGFQFPRNLEIRSKNYLDVTGIGGRVNGPSKTNGIVPLYCDGYLLKQEGCISWIRCGGGNALANVHYERMAHSTDGVKVFIN